MLWIPVSRLHLAKTVADCPTRPGAMLTGTHKSSYLTQAVRLFTARRFCKIVPAYVSFVCVFCVCDGVGMKCQDSPEFLCHRCCFAWGHVLELWSVAVGSYMKPSELWRRIPEERRRFGDEEVAIPVYGSKLVPFLHIHFIHKCVCVCVGVCVSECIMWLRACFIWYWI